MHICVPTNSLDAENLVLTSASGLLPQSSTSLPRESASDVLPMIWASDPPPADDIVQCLVGSSVSSRPTAIAPIAPFATADTAVPLVVDPPPTTHPYGTRLKHNIKQLKVRIDGTIRYFCGSIFCL